MEKRVRYWSPGLVTSVLTEMPHMDVVIASFLTPSSLPDFPQASQCAHFPIGLLSFP